MPLTNAERQKRYRQRLQRKAKGTTTLTDLYLASMVESADETMVHAAGDEAELDALRIVREKFAAFAARPETIDEATRQAIDRVMLYATESQWVDELKMARREVAKRARKQAKKKAA